MKRLFPNCLSLYFCFLLSASCVAGEPTAKPHKVLPCPDSPNCVSSLSTDEAHFIEPLHYAGRLADARKRLINILQNTKRVRLVKIEAQYIHAEFRSMVFRFVDDLEFYFPSEKSIIHVKSASRTGYYDLGVNRRRVERLRSAFENSTK
jgi:uncharacterized protein (DUF1499 family)